MKKALVVIMLGILAIAVFQTPKHKTNEQITRTPLSPAPTDSSMSPKQLALFNKYHLDGIRLPKGFRISVFAEVQSARSLAVSPSGVVYVGNRVNGTVSAVSNGHVYSVADSLNVPNGVAYKDGDLYVATIDSVYKIAGVEKDLANSPKPELIYNGFPKNEAHGWKFIAFGSDGKLYVPVGLPCNSCDPGNPIYGTITRLNLITKKVEIVAKGVRNTVGFDWKPDTKALWFTDNGLDGAGDNIPADELNKVSYMGENFGAPYCYQGDFQDPNLTPRKKCSEFTPPVQNLGPHVAALGMRFYTGSMFPSQYKNRIFIAEHGSWNRSTPIGYRVTLVTLIGDRPVLYEPFAEGWLHGPTQDDTYGRPVDIAQWIDGSLLVSDDKAGVIYRITYQK